MAGYYVKKSSKFFLILSRFNVRDMFELYAGETDPAKIARLMSDARVNLETMQKMSEWDSHTWTFMATKGNYSQASKPRG